MHHFRDGVAQQVSYFQSKKNVQLYAKRYIPPKQKAIVVFMHGLHEHSGRYEDLFSVLLDDHFSIYTFDFEGHGNSKGERGYIEDLESLTDDALYFLLNITATENDTRDMPPIFLIGYAMGGSVALRCAIRRNNWFRGVIMCAPVLQVNSSFHGLLQNFAGVLNMVAGKRAFVDFMIDDHCRDKAVVEEFKRDPLCRKEKIITHTANEILKATAELQNTVSSMRVPFLIVHGDQDKICDVRGSENFFRLSHSADKTLKIFPGCWHDILHEPNKEEVFVEILKWLNDRCDRQQQQ